MTVKSLKNIQIEKYANKRLHLFIILTIKYFIQFNSFNVLIFYWNNTWTIFDCTALMYSPKT